MKKLDSGNTGSHGNLQHLVCGLNPMLNWLNKNGIDPKPHLLKANIDPSQLRTSGATIYPAHEIGFINQLYRDLDIPDLGLNIGPGFKLAYFGLLGLAAMTSTNLYQCWKIIFEHIELTWSYCRLSIYSKGDLAFFEINPNRDLGESLIMMIDRDLSAALNLSYEALGSRPALIRVELKHAPTSYIAKYEEVFNCPIIFNASKNRVVCDKKILDMPLANSDANMSRIYLQQCLADLKLVKKKANFSELVRDLILESDTPYVSLENIAKELNVTSRTVQRRLAAEGCRYKNLVSEIRFNLAKEYLATTELSLDEITDKLIFHDTAAFSNAFRRWTGISPIAYRKPCTV